MAPLVGHRKIFRLAQSTYGVSSRSAATNGTVANEVSTMLWNPHATARLNVTYISFFKQGAVAENPWELRRVTVRGVTPSRNVVPGISEHYARLQAPPSGVELDGGPFATEPTKEAGVIAKDLVTLTEGSAIIAVFAQGIEVPPGSGLAVCYSGTGIFRSCDFYWVWDE